jgi:hypothetical protein
VNLPKCTLIDENHFRKGGTAREGVLADRVHPRRDFNPAERGALRESVDEEKPARSRECDAREAVAAIESRDSFDRTRDFDPREEAAAVKSEDFRESAGLSECNVGEGRTAAKS